MAAELLVGALDLPLKRPTHSSGRITHIGIGMTADALCYQRYCDF